MFQRANAHNDFMGRIYTFSGGKYSGIQFFQIIKRMRRTVLMPIIFRLERREEGKF